MKIVLATKNDGKIDEIKEILDLPRIAWVTYRDFSEWPEVREEGKTYLANAAAKARTVAEFFDLPALADDSGLEVKALDGRPGVRSARYAGAAARDADNIAKLLGEMASVPQGSRSARFVAVVAVAFPDGRLVSATGICDGSILTEPRGGAGFGYDPLFVPDGLDRTMAELTPKEKNNLSHRGKALRGLRRELEELCDAD